MVTWVIRDIGAPLRYVPIQEVICILIPDDQLIDNSGDIDYSQLYAQVVFELNGLRAPYWFHNDEVTRIQQLNQNFMEQKDITEMICACFRQPGKVEPSKSMNGDQLIAVIQGEYPTLTNTPGTKVKLGKAMNALGYESKSHSNIPFYQVIPLKESA